jgi:hypothetical protein
LIKEGNIVDIVRKILNNEQGNELSKLTAHIIRVLAINHGINWISELKADIIKLLNFNVEPFTFKDEDVSRAVKILKDNQLVQTEYHKRGNLPTSDVYVDQLIYLCKPNDIEQALKTDPLYKNYQYFRQKLIKESLKR